MTTFSLVYLFVAAFEAMVGGIATAHPIPGNSWIDPHFWYVLSIVFALYGAADLSRQKK